MASRKIAISLPSDLAAAVRRDADEAGTTVSGWLADAAAGKLRRKYAFEALAAFETEHGEITASEQTEVREAWGD